MSSHAVPERDDRNKRPYVLQNVRNLRAIKSEIMPLSLQASLSTGFLTRTSNILMWLQTKAASSSSGSLPFPYYYFLPFFFFLFQANILSQFFSLRFFLTERERERERAS